MPSPKTKYSYSIKRGANPGGGGGRNMTTNRDYSVNLSVQQVLSLWVQGTTLQHFTDMTELEFVMAPHAPMRMPSNRDPIMDPNGAGWDVCLVLHLYKRCGTGCSCGVSSPRSLSTGRWGCSCWSCCSATRGAASSPWCWSVLVSWPPSSEASSPASSQSVAGQSKSNKLSRAEVKDRRSSGRGVPRGRKGHGTTGGSGVRCGSDHPLCHHILFTHPGYSVK